MAPAPPARPRARAHRRHRADDRHGPPGGDQRHHGRRPGTATTDVVDRYHGDSETAIHVLRGHPVFVFARKENPTGEEAVVVIARSSQQAIVVNLPGLA